MKKKLLIVLLIMSVGAFMGLKIKIDRIKREKIPGASVIYVPSGKYLKYATFGYSSLFADLVYLWAIQYYTTYTVVNRFEYLDHIFSVISELDPLYLDPYEIGAMIAVYEAKDINLACKILDRGLEKNPDQWIFPFQAAHYAQMIARDYALAQEYYKRTMEVEGAPSITKRLYANVAFKLADYQTAWETWLNVFENAEDDRVKKIANNHLYQVKSAMDIQVIHEAIEKYKQKYGRNPANLSQLVISGILSHLPQDLDGKDYLYDPQSGEVKAASIPWKR